jgi:hypothetical protein
MKKLTFNFMILSLLYGTFLFCSDKQPSSKEALLKAEQQLNPIEWKKRFEPCCSQFYEGVQQQPDGILRKFFATSEEEKNLGGRRASISNADNNSKMPLKKLTLIVPPRIISNCEILPEIKEFSDEDDDTITL